MSGRFGNLLTAMVTPFDASGKLDLPTAEKLAVWLSENGSDGLVVSGSTGEAATLSDEEKYELWRAVVGATAGKTKVVAGTGTYDTAHSEHLTKTAEKAGVDGVLVVTPYYNRPPQAGLIAHFKAIAASTDMPVILYDIPIRSGIKMEHATIMELAGVSNIVGVKDACSDAQGAARIVAQAPDGFELYSGNDGDTLPWLAVGAVGLISTSAHVAGPEIAKMIRLHQEGDLAGARKIHLSLMPVFDIMGLTTNPIPLKAAMEIIGHPVGDPRLPLVPATPDQKAKIRAALEGADISAFDLMGSASNG
ncbi:MAG: 4-hydroxy-tetrahydrodipicolinate synthase [Actinomycetota bacterium]